MNTPTCPINTLNSLLETIKAFGKNKADHPFGIGYHDKEWWVYVEMDAPSGTFDVETHHVNLQNALANALARVRREMSISMQATLGGRPQS